MKLELTLTEVGRIRVALTSIINSLEETNSHSEMDEDTIAAWKYLHDKIAEQHNDAIEKRYNK